MAAVSGKLLPGGLLNTDSTYGASTKQMADLNKYIWSGVLLPTTEEDYKRRCGLTAIKASLQSDVTNLLTTYTSIKTNSQQFKDVIFPKIVDVASLVYSYASKAGGTNKKSSYYNFIIEQVQIVGAENSKAAPDATVITKAVNSISTLVDSEIKAIDNLVAKAEACVQDLNNFEGKSQVDKNNLQIASTAINNKLAGASGDIATLQQKLLDQKATLAKDQAEYEHDVIVAATTLTYAWAWPIGPICAAVVAGVYGDKAVKMAATISAMKDLISSTDKSIAEDKAVLADCTCIKADLDLIFSLIGPAIATIQKMKGDWQAVKNDLKGVKETCSGAGEESIEDILNLQSESVMDSWNTLKTAADTYRKNAYVTTPATKTMDEAKNMLKAAAAA